MISPLSLTLLFVAEKVISSSLLDPLDATCSFAGVDFSPLRRALGDYSGKDDGDPPQYDFKLNFCGPVTAIGKCKEGSFSLCQWEEGVYVGALGSFDLDPPPAWDYIDPLTPDQGVKVNFQNGDLCWNEGDMIPRDVTINLICAATTSTSFVVMEPEACTYTVDFDTPLACGGSPPPSSSSTGSSSSSSSSEEPSSSSSSDPGPVPGCGYMGVDLSSLHLNEGDYTGSDGSYDYKMNVCGVSNSGGKCTDEKNTICQFEAGEFSASLGVYEGVDPPPEWGYIDIEYPSKGLTLTFQNGLLCWIGGAIIPRVVIVNYKCADQTSTTFEVYEDPGTCIFHITLETDKSCGPSPSSSSSSSSTGESSSSSSSSSSSLPPPQVPGRMQAPKLSKVRDNSVEVSFIPPWDGGDPITTYVIYRNSQPNEPQGWVLAVKLPSSRGTSTTVSDLTEGGEYMFTIAAVNNLGMGELSPASVRVITGQGEGFTPIEIFGYVSCVVILLTVGVLFALSRWRRRSALLPTSERRRLVPTETTDSSSDAVPALPKSGGKTKTTGGAGKPEQTFYI